MIIDYLLTKFLIKKGLSSKVILMINAGIFVLLYTGLMALFIKSFEKRSIVEHIPIIALTYIMFAFNMYKVDKILKERSK